MPLTHQDILGIAIKHKAIKVLDFNLLTIIKYLQELPDVSGRAHVTTFGQQTALAGASGAPATVHTGGGAKGHSFYHQRVDLEFWCPAGLCYCLMVREREIELDKFKAFVGRYSAIAFSVKDKSDFSVPAAVIDFKSEHYFQSAVNYQNLGGIGGDLTSFLRTNHFRKNVDKAVTRTEKRKLFGHQYYKDDVAEQIAGEMLGKLKNPGVYMMIEFDIGATIRDRALNNCILAFNSMVDFLPTFFDPLAGFFQFTNDEDMISFIQELLKQKGPDETYWMKRPVIITEFFSVTQQ